MGVGNLVSREFQVQSSVFCDFDKLLFNPNGPDGAEYIDIVPFSACYIPTPARATFFIVQKAAITNLLTKFASEYAFMLDAEGSMILAYIGISDLGPASAKRRQLLQTSTSATTNIPLPAGLDEASTTQASAAIDRFIWLLKLHTPASAQPLDAVLFPPLLQACTLSFVLRRLGC